MKELIGSSEAILQIRKVLERISVVDSLIFIQGETGVERICLLRLSIIKASDEMHHL